MTVFLSILSAKKFSYLSRFRQKQNTDAANVAMEVVQGVKTVRLKTRKNKYLTAGSDEESVRTDRDGSSEQAIWTIEYVEDKNFIRIKSCYGKYLTATNEPLLPRGKGHRVMQTLPERLNSSTEWEIEKEGSKLRFKTSYGHYLRPYGGLPPIRNMVGHDIPVRSQTEEKILWELEIVEMNIDSDQVN